jgi:hypothetical protein
MSRGNAVSVQERCGSSEKAAVLSSAGVGEARASSKLWRVRLDEIMLSRTLGVALDLRARVRA